jgi:hypothetical protein
MTKVRFLASWFTAVVVIMAAGCASKPSKPSTYRDDNSLIANFQAHKADFNTLLEMFRADKGLIYFSRGTTIPDNPQSVGVGPERLGQYQRLFSKLGLDGMAAGDRSTGARDEVWFFTPIEGARPSTFKHYAYVSNPTRGVVRDLDKEGSKTNPYRRIEDSWYLALDDAD